MRLRAVLSVVTAVIALASTVSAEAGVQPAPAPVVASQAGGFDFADPDVVATGLDVPWGLDFLPDGSALVGQRDLGTVVRIRPGRPPVPVARIPGMVAGGEGGLLGLAVSPRYRQDRWVYVCFTTASDIRITRFRLSAPQHQQVILSGLTRASFHNGGRIAFGPDGLLYAGIGDAGVPANAQDLASRNGKILRIRPNGGIPADNPFPGSPVFSYGHRNVQGLTWDPRGRLFASEFGQATWDEVNVIVRGGNYGWPVVEGPSVDPRFCAPVVVWPPAQASPSGVAFAGDTLFVAALRGTRLWAVPVSAAGQVGTPVAELVGVHGRLRTVVAARDGSLWVTTSNRDDNGTPTPLDDRVLRFTTGERQPPPAGRAGAARS